MAAAEEQQDMVPAAEQGAPCVAGQSAAGQDVAHAAEQSAAHAAGQGSLEFVRGVLGLVDEPHAFTICPRFDALGADGHPARLGIMGGTFDPIHSGHLVCAEQVREAFDLDAVVFIPTGNPVFKRDKKIAPARDRLAMCCKAVASNPYFDVSPLEIERGGDTYTIDTLRTLRAHYPENVELHFIVGADAAATIAKWRNAAEMGEIARFVAVDRPGYELSEAQRQAIRDGAPGIGFSFITIEALRISSSELRARMLAGKSIRYLTPQVVVDHIMEHGLYKEG